MVKRASNVIKQYFATFLKSLWSAVIHLAGTLSSSLLFQSKRGRMNEQVKRRTREGAKKKQGQWHLCTEHRHKIMTNWVSNTLLPQPHVSCVSVKRTFVTCIFFHNYNEIFTQLCMHRVRGSTCAWCVFPRERERLTSEQRQSLAENERASNGCSNFTDSYERKHREEEWREGEEEKSHACVSVRFKWQCKMTICSEKWHRCGVSLFTRDES